MKLKEVLLAEAAVWKNNRNPSAPATDSPQAAAPKPVAQKPTGPGAFRKGLYKATGFGGSPDVQSAVSRDNYIKKFAGEYANLAADQSGAFNQKQYLQSYINQNNWGPLTTQQQLALDSAARTSDPNKIGAALYAIGKQNRGGGARNTPAVGKPVPANTDPNSKNTLGTQDKLSPATDRIITAVGMMASASMVDDLEAIMRAALNALNKAAPGEYAEFVKFVATGQKPKPNLAPAATDKTGAARTATGKAAVGVQDLPPNVQQQIAQQQR